MAHNERSNTSATPPQGSSDVDKLTWTAIVKVGVPAALLTFVIVWLTGDFNVRLRAIETQHVDISGGVTAIKEITGQSDMAQQQILYVLQTLCVNQARTDAHRSDCLRTIGTRNR